MKYKQKVWYMKQNYFYFEVFQFFMFGVMNSFRLFIIIIRLRCLDANLNQLSKPGSKILMKTELITSVWKNN